MHASSFTSRKPSDCRWSTLDFYCFFSYRLPPNNKPHFFFFSFLPLSDWLKKETGRINNELSLGREEMHAKVSCPRGDAYASSRVLFVCCKLLVLALFFFSFFVSVPFAGSSCVRVRVRGTLVEASRQARSCKKGHRRCVFFPLPSLGGTVCWLGQYY